MMPISEETHTTVSDADDPRLYVRIANDLREKMDAGTLEPGARPSITVLSQDWGTARQTAAKALRKLEGEKRVKRYPGVGYVVLPK